MFYNEIGGAEMTNRIKPGADLSLLTVFANAQHPAKQEITVAKADIRSR